MTCSIRTLLISIAFLGGQYFATAQQRNFTAYYQQINKAEELFVNNKATECMQTYDRVFKEYNNPFLKDCYVAAQIAWYAADTQHFYSYLAVGFKNGMPISAIDRAPILKTAFANPDILGRVEREFAANYRPVTTSQQDIDTLLLMSYAADSMKVAYGKSRNTNEQVATKFVELEEAERQYVYHKYISKGIFPLEKVTGVRTDTTWSSFYKRQNKVDLYPNPFQAKGTQAAKSSISLGPAQRQEYDLSTTLGFNIFIHSTCVIEEYGKDLWQCVLNGYMHPMDYCLLIETSVGWNREGSPFFKYSKNCNIVKQDAYYNILHQAPGRTQTFVTDPQLIALVEKNREEHLCQKYSVDVVKKRLEKEKGFSFFFGFMDTR